MLPQNLSKLHMLSLLRNFCPNKKKNKLTKFSELWMLMVMVNFPNKKSRMDIKLISEEQ
jgi:hypothetical protein